MADITLTVPDAQVPNLAAAARFWLVADWGHTQQEVDGYSDAQCVRQWTKYMWVEGTGTASASEAAETARQDGKDGVDGIIA